MSDYRNSIQNALLHAVSHLPEGRNKNLVRLNILWHRIVGQLISKHSQIVELKPGGTAVVAIQSQSWKNPIEISSQYILRKINEITDGKIKLNRIEIIIRKTTPSDSGKRVTIRGLDPDPEILASIESIPDQAIRESFLRAYLNYPAQKK